MKHKYYSVFYGPSRFLSRFSRKPKRAIPEDNHPTTRKQNLACLTCDPSETRTHSGELTSDLEH